MNLYDPWSTHLPALVQAVMRYGSRVLEIGCGWYSTPMLHTISSQVITLESDPQWAAKFKSVARPGQLHIAPDILYAAKAFSVHTFDVVFVDCDPVGARAACVELFLDRRCCVVAHDTEVNNYTELLKRIRYQKHFDFVMPRTSHLSNFLDVSL
jgi:hypothetical protein